MFTFSCSIRPLLTGLIVLSLFACSDGATGTHGYPSAATASNSGIDEDYTLTVAYILPPEADVARANDSAAFTLTGPDHFILSWDPTDETADKGNYEIVYARTTPDDGKPMRNRLKRVLSEKNP